MELDLSNSNLYELPKDFSVKDILTKFNCSYNQITTLAGVKLPNSLKEFYCQFNEISSLSGILFPNSLESLSISGNKIKTLNDACLPCFLDSFACGSNEINKIDNLPNSLRVFFCNNNQIKVIENLPLGLNTFAYSCNPIEYVDNVRINKINFTLAGYQAIRRIQKRIKLKLKRNKAAKLIGRKVLHWLWSPNGPMVKKMIKKMVGDGLLN